MSAKDRLDHFEQDWSALVRYRGGDVLRNVLDGSINLLGDELIDNVRADLFAMLDKYAAIHRRRLRLLARAEAEQTLRDLSAEGGE